MCHGGTPVQIDFCEQVCGDGININKYHECDDGNTEKLDGCSHECRIENHLWTCVQSDEYSPTICTFEDKFATSRNIGYTASSAAVLSACSGNLATVLVQQVGAIVPFLQVPIDEELDSFCGDM
ncbi:hypothetical protein COB52_05835 [Candidatus Kaiserbacteria bacterium]|nr:MAG: hypothetical protein COB52_05835 [Candidatus Kaiserbacteria bacterium]